MKTRRQSRHFKLRKIGFLPFEAISLSRLPLTGIPYYEQLLRDRYIEYMAHLRAGGNRDSFDKLILERYVVNDWLNKGKTRRLGEPVRDVWVMLRRFEDDYKYKAPQYESPWEKRGRKMKDFFAKFERTIARQRGLANA